MHIYHLVDVHVLGEEVRPDKVNYMGDHGGGGGGGGNVASASSDYRSVRGEALVASVGPFGVQSGESSASSYI